MSNPPSQSVPDLKRLRVAIQMDPIERVNIDADSTFAMAEEAQNRGFPVWVYGVETLSWWEGKITARARPAVVRRVKGDHVTLGDPVTLDLERDVDVVLMRQDPPFDMAYITAAHILEFLKGKTLVVNDPFGCDRAQKRLFRCYFQN